MIINFCKGDDDFYEQGTRETRRARERAPANDEYVNFCSSWGEREREIERDKRERV